METVKRCPACAQEKPLSEFNRNRTQSHGVQSRCRICEREYGAKWRQDNAEAVKRAQQKYTRSNYEGRALIHAKSRAKKLGIPFGLKRSDLSWPERCPILGIKLVYEPGARARDDAPSLDRVVPALGYVKGNVQVISARANRIKNDSTIEELRKILTYMELLWA